MALSEDEAIFLGYLVAEGYALSYDNEVRFTNTDPEVRRRVHQDHGAVFSTLPVQVTITACSM